MKSIKNIVSRILPKRVKAIIKPVYNEIESVFKRPDTPLTIGIKSVEGIELAYRKGTTDEIAIDYTFDDDIYFSGVPEYQINDDDVIIDIGAHIGTFVLSAASRVKHGKIHAIEASQDSFNLLRINLALNNVKNVSAHHLAIGDKPGACNLYYDTDYLGHSTVRKHSRVYETVDCYTLTGFMENNNIEKCHFLKLNCEGAEFPIILSTPAVTLNRCEVILILYHCDQWRGNTEKDLLSHLQSAGFNTKVRNQTEKRGWIIAKNEN